MLSRYCSRESLDLLRAACGRRGSEGSERVHPRLEHEAARLECARGIDHLGVLLGDRGREGGDLPSEIDPELFRHTGRLGDAGFENGELLAERLGLCPTIRSARVLARPDRAQRVDLVPQLLCDVLDAMTDFLEPTIESGDLELPAGDPPDRLADDARQGADARPERLDRVEQPVHPLLEHRVGLEPFLEGFEIAAHRAYGSLGAGERLVAPLFQPRDRFFAALLDLPQLAVGRSELPRSGSCRVAKEVDPLHERVDLAGDAFLESRIGGVGRRRCQDLRRPSPRRPRAEPGSRRTWPRHVRPASRAPRRAPTSCCAPRPSGPTSSARPRPGCRCACPARRSSRGEDPRLPWRRSRAVRRLGDEPTDGVELSAQSDELRRGLLGAGADQLLDAPVE